MKVKYTANKHGRINRPARAKFHIEPDFGQGIWWYQFDNWTQTPDTKYSYSSSAYHGKSLKAVIRKIHQWKKEGNLPKLRWLIMTGWVSHDMYVTI